MWPQPTSSESSRATPDRPSTAARSPSASSTMAASSDGNPGATSLDLASTTTRTAEMSRSGSPAPSRSSSRISPRRHGETCSDDRRQPRRHADPRRSARSLALRRSRDHAGDALATDAAQPRRDALTGLEVSRSEPRLEQVMSFAVVKPYCHINERGETVSYTHNEMVGLARMAIADVGYSPRDTGEIYAIKSL